MKAECRLARNVIALVLAMAGTAGAAGVDLKCPRGSAERSSRSTWTNEDWCARSDGKGAKHGPFRTWSEEGSLEGAYRDGKPDGTWVGSYRGGLKSGEAEFKAGVLNGRFRALYVNGKTLAEANFMNGKLAAPMVFFDPTGRRRLVMSVDGAGMPRDQTAFDDNGKPVMPGSEWYRQNIGRSDFLDLVMRMGGIASLH